jgi:flagellar export protein FliJ
MSRFNFRLQRVLDLKQRHAQAAALQLAAAHARANDARQALQTLSSIRQAGGAQLAAAHSEQATAGQLQNISYVLERMDHRVDQAADVVKAASTQLEGAQSEMTLAQQAKRALDRLRERQLGDWQDGVRHMDRQQMDSLALNLFTRRAPQQLGET